MRQIKFRAWHKKFKLMMGVSHLGFNNGELSAYPLGEVPKGIKLDFPSVQLGRWHDYLRIAEGKDQDFELMQFTGLKDKNGSEIFESDHIDFNGLEYEVVFEHGGWLAKCLTTGPNPDGTESKRPDEWLFDFNDKVEIVGNKYED